MKKIALSTIIALLITLVFITVSLAATYSVKITLKDELSADIAQGRTITFLIKLSDIDVEDGIGAISGKFEYDTNVFEKIVAADIKASDGWGSISYNDIEGNPQQGYFVTERSAGDSVIENNDLMEITATVRTNAPTGRTEIKISNITASNGNEDTTIADVLASITIVGKQSTGNPNDNNTNNNNTNNNNTNNNNTNNNNTNNNNTNNNIDNNATTNETIPHTGIKDYTMPFILIFLGVAVISYIRYKKIKNI